MTTFDDSNWAKPDITRDYRDSAEIYVIEGEKYLLFCSHSTNIL